MYHVWIRIPKLTVMQMQMVQNGDHKCSKKSVSQGKEEKENSEVR